MKLGGLFLALTAVAQAVVPLPSYLSTEKPPAQPFPAVEGAYELSLSTVAGNPVWRVKAHDAAGHAYAAETQRQLLREYGDSLPAQLYVQDFPRYGWRGLHLDVARHFFPPAVIRKVIDSMAALKLNRLHLHLTDGPGWRFPVPGYPRLTEVGAWCKYPEDEVWNWSRVQVGYTGEGASGGFYTREELQELVAYARERHVMIVPEVDNPGHFYAALVAYPELGVPHMSQCGRDAMDVRKPAARRFMMAVLDELERIFPPATPIHLGGDEVDCSLISKEEQRIWMQSLVDELHSRGREAVTWDEAAEYGVRGQTVMLWRDGALPRMLQEGHPLILCPMSRCYFDFPQSRSPEEPPGMNNGITSVEDVFALTPPAQGNIRGLQANLWTEYISTEPHLYYMLFPRLAALAECAWSTTPSRLFVDFRADWDCHSSSIRPVAGAEKHN